MLNVRVCPSCLNHNKPGMSRVSQNIWDKCLSYVIGNDPSVVLLDDYPLEVHSADGNPKLLMTDEGGFFVDDELLKKIITNEFESF